jgi:alkanesulfonate monooxygenase SsuD/methylene tetrahydromethanopterin reductase-like flavin-dependent oxidoreductase (luciferase family)
MRFGTYYFLQAPPSISHPDVVRREIEQMVWTEELGFDSVWLTEHHFIEYGLSVSPAVLAAAAMRTRHVRIGLAAAILPFHDPVRLAPLQQPHPPLYVVCTSPDTIEATALRGVPMLNSLLRGGVEQLARSRDTYVKACEKTGRSDREIASLLARWGVSHHVYVAPTDAEALAEARDAEMWYQEWLRRFIVPERIDRVHPLLQPGFRAMEERFAKVSWEQLVAESVAFGSPDTVARRVEEFQRLGVGEMLCWMNFGGLPPERVRRSMELFAREVMPRFR